MMLRTHRDRPGARALRAALLTVLAAPLEAQVCQGVPLGPGGATVAVLAGRPDQADYQLAAEASYRLPPPLVVSAGYARTTFDQPGASAMNAVRVGVIVDAVPRLPRRLAGLSLCPTLAAHQERFEDLRVLTVPLGVAAGAARSLGGAWSVAGYAEPRAVYTRNSVLGITRTAVARGVRAGANLSRGRLYAGVGYDWVNAAGDNDGLVVVVGASLGARAPSSGTRETGRAQ